MRCKGKIGHAALMMDFSVRLYTVVECLGLLVAVHRLVAKAREYTRTMIYQPRVLLTLQLCLMAHTADSTQIIQMCHG